MSIPINPQRAVNELPSLGNARISPDGERIVYVRTQVNSETGKDESQIWLCDVDGNNRRRLTWTGASNGGATWSPDGYGIAFVSKRDGDHPHAICVLGFTGGEARIVTRHAASPGDLAWSPDGTTLSYTAAVDPENPNETPRDPKAPAPVRVVRRIDYKQDGYGYLNDLRAQVF
ncbi:MAG: TolB family protein, partial [Thermomicrobiales bacterium]